MKKASFEERRGFFRTSIGIAGSLTVLSSLSMLEGCESTTFKSSSIVGPSVENNMVTLDTTTTDYATLANVDGLVSIDVNNNGQDMKLMVFRVSETEAVTMSRLCTHQGCDLGTKYSGELISPTTILCGCHASRFNLTNGHLIHGAVPGQQNLATFPTTINGNTITITLA